MSRTHIRNADLNLLVGFQALMEERTVSLAAKRMFLSQSAMSRMIDRAQELFHDVLFIRSGDGYEPTHRAVTIYAELREMLPRIELLLQGSDFHPAKIKDTYRIGASDTGAAVFVGGLMKHVTPQGPGIRVEVLPKPGHFGLVKLERNEIDLVLTIDAELRAWEARGGGRLERQELWRDRPVCFVRAGHPLSRGHLTLDRYLKAEHCSIAWVDDHRVVSGPEELQDFIAQILKPLGRTRNVRMMLPYGNSIPSIVENTDLVATLMLLQARTMKTSKTCIISAPKELRRPFTLYQVWHPRHNSSPFHRWMRQLMADVAVELHDSFID